LTSKRVADCGCGNGVFVIDCLKNNITTFAYGIDDDLMASKAREAYRNHFVRGTFQDTLPWGQLDYIFFVSSLFYQEFNKRNFVKMIDKLSKQLKPTGEIRIYPLEYITKNTGDRTLYPLVIRSLKSRRYNFKLIPIETNFLKNGLRATELLIIRPKG
jgi:trans-aconitate methyltransferase